MAQEEAPAEADAAEQDLGTSSRGKDVFSESDSNPEAHIRHDNFEIHATRYPKCAPAKCEQQKEVRETEEDSDEQYGEEEAEEELGDSPMSTDEFMTVVTDGPDVGDAEATEAFFNASAYV